MENDLEFPGQIHLKFAKMKAPKVMPVNSIAQMMKPAHLKAPSKSPTALGIIKKITAVSNEASIPDVKVRNGVGHFVLPLQRLHFTYCSHCGDSATTKYFKCTRVYLNCLGNIFRSILLNWQRRILQLSLSLSPVGASGQPYTPTTVILSIDTYLDLFSIVEGRFKAVSVDNKPVHEIAKIVEGLKNETGAKAKMFHQSVQSDTPAIRPVWSPFHSTPIGDLDPLAKYRNSSQK